MPSFLRTSVSPSPNLECSLNKTFYDATWALKWHYHSHFIEGETKALRTEARLRIRSKVSNLHSSDLSHLPDWGNTKRPGIQLVTQPDAEKKKKILFLSYFMGVHWNVLGVHQFPKYSLSTPATVQGQFPVSLETLALLVDSVSWWELMKPPCKKQPKSHVSNANHWTLGLCLNASHGHLLPLSEERRPPLRINNPPKTTGSIPYW